VPADLIGPGIDGIELSPELVADQIGEDIPAQLSRRAGGTYDRYALGIEEVMQVEACSCRRRGLRLPGRAQDDAGVDHAVAIGIKKDGIQIHLRDLGIGQHKIGYREDQLFQGGDIGRVAPIALEEGIALDLLYHVPGIGCQDGKGAEGDVLQYLHEHAPQAEHQYRPEGGIIGHAYDGLHPWPGHPLHRYPFHLLVGECFLHLPVGSSDHPGVI